VSSVSEVRIGPPVRTTFWIAFGFGLSVLLWIVLDLVYRRTAEGPDIRTFLVLAVLCFLAVMPFSYMHWEKYFMLVLPLVGILVLRDGRRSRRRTRQRPRRLTDDATARGDSFPGAALYIRRSASSRLRWAKPIRAWVSGWAFFGSCSASTTSQPE
jgi:hypothetical protein